MAARHEPLGEGELDRVLDETVATGTDDEGGSGLDAVLHHHVRRDAACMEGDLKPADTKKKKKKVTKSNFSGVRRTRTRALDFNYGLLIAAAGPSEEPTRKAGENVVNLCFGSRGTDPSGNPTRG